MALCQLQNTSRDSHGFYNLLPCNPLLSSAEIIRVIIEAESVFRVVVACKVGENGSTLEDGKAIPVMVNDSRDTTIGVDLDEPGFFLNILADVNALKYVFLAVRFLQLLEDDRGFVTIRSSPCEKLNS